MTIEILGFFSKIRVDHGQNYVHIPITQLPQCYALHYAMNIVHAITHIIHTSLLFGRAINLYRQLYGLKEIHVEMVYCIDKTMGNVICHNHNVVSAVFIPRHRHQFLLNKNRYRCLGAINQQILHAKMKEWLTYTKYIHSANVTVVAVLSAEVVRFENFFETNQVGN